MANLTATPEMIRQLKILVNQNGTEELGFLVSSIVYTYLISDSFADLVESDRDRFLWACMGLKKIFPEDNSEEILLEELGEIKEVKKILAKTN